MRTFTDQLIESKKDGIHKFVFGNGTAENREMIYVRSVEEQQPDENKHITGPIIPSSHKGL